MSARRDDPPGDPHPRGRPPGAGLPPAGPGPEDGAMNSPKPASSDPAMAAKIEQWTRLRDELVQLNAHLEYLRLMLRLQGGRKG